MAVDRYVGLAVSRAARICASAHGGGALTSSARALLSDHDQSALRMLGAYRLKDFEAPEPISQLLIEGSPRSSRRCARRPSPHHADGFDRLQVEHPGVKDVLLRLLAQQLARASDRIVEAHYTDAETRVRRRLCELGERYATGGGAAVVPLTQEDLAGMAGTSRATANRVLRDQERRGNVELGRGRILIRDLEEFRSHVH